MRIIAGEYKGRKLETPKGSAVRPTSDKVRGAIFNILNNQIDWAETRVFDVFCGTGAFGIEALSRGALGAGFVDKDLTIAKANCEKLGVDGVELIKADATKLRKSTQQYNLIFLDPPYHEGLLAASLTSLLENNYIAGDALIVAETDTKHQPEILTGFEVNDERVYGGTRIVFLGTQ